LVRGHGSPAVLPAGGYRSYPDGFAVTGGPRYLRYKTPIKPNLKFKQSLNLFENKNMDFEAISLNSNQIDLNLNHGEKLGCDFWI
jgi:hypothetical protein